MTSSKSTTLTTKPPLNIVGVVDVEMGPSSDVDEADDESFAYSFDVEEMAAGSDEDMIFEFEE